MNSTEDKPHWWCSAHFRITHPSEDLSEFSKRLKVAIPAIDSTQAVETNFGMKRNKFFWISELKIQSPDRPDALIAWAEQLAKENELPLTEILKLDGQIYVYVGIHTSVLALGFDLPPTPTVSKLGVKIGLEYFSS